MTEFHSIFKDELLDFLKLRVVGLSQYAVKHDICYLTSFDSHLVNTGISSKAIPETSVNGWIKGLSGKTSTIANKVIVIRIFLKHIQSQGYAVYIPPIPQVADDYIPYIFTDEELSKIFNAADNLRITKGQSNPHMNLEFPMILRLLYGCGLRIGETLALQMKDVDLYGGILTILHAKMDKQRFVPMCPSLTEILQRYCLAMGIVGMPNAFVFPSADCNKPVSVRSIRSKFDVLIKNTGLMPAEREWHERGPCMHCFRHITRFSPLVNMLLYYLFAEKQISSDSIAFTDLNYDTILGYLSWLETERKCSAATRNQRLSALSSFANYAQNRSFDAALVFRRDINKIPSKKHRQKQRSVFTLEEVTMLLNIPGNDRDVELRDKTLLSVMYASGARAQEICDLAVGDIRFNGDTTSLTLNGKGNKLRRVSIPKGCALLLRQFIDKRGIANNGKRYVFSSQTHEHMTVSCIEAIFKKYVRLAKDAHPDLFKEIGYSPHSMRHSTATHMLEAGVPLLVIKNFLGHSSFQSTQIYAAVTQSTLNRHVKEWNEKWGPIHDDIFVEPDPGQIIPDFLKTARMLNP